MTSLAAPIPHDQRRQLQRSLRDRADEWIRNFYRHDLLLARAVRSVQLEVTAEFDKQVVRPLLREIGAKLAVIRPKSGDLVVDLLPEVQALRRTIETTVARGSDAVRLATEKHLTEIATHEVSWVQETVRKIDPTFGAGVEGRFGEGVADAIDAAKKSLREQTWLGDGTEKWFEKMLEKPTADNTRAWVTTGLRRGLSDEEIMRALKGTKAQAGILSDKPRSAIEALVRTSATHAAATGKIESYKALGVTHWRFIATLDHRTSLQCAVHDGQVYPIDGGPVPPLHPNCRSQPAPVIGSPGKAPSGKRASITGQVPASTTFPDWLQTIPREEQDLVLGRARAEAWRSGRLSLRDMLGRDLQPLSLADLRKMERIR